MKQHNYVGNACLRRHPEFIVDCNIFPSKII